MTESQNEENKLQSVNEHKFDPILHYINYKSSSLVEGKYKYDSITNKLIEVILIKIIELILKINKRITIEFMISK